MVFPSLTSIAIATAVIIVAGFIATIVHSLLRAILDTRSSKPASIWISRSSQYLIYGAAFYYSFYHILNLNFAAIAASAGILGVAVAFSSQQIIQNVIAGLLITVRRPIRLEDYISIGFPDIGISKVKDMSLFQVTLKNLDGRLIYVPNSTILTQVITNYTRSTALMVSIPITVSEVKNLDSVRKSALETAKNDPGILPNIPLKERNILKDIAPQVYRAIGDSAKKKDYSPIIITKSLASTGITLEARLWITDIAHRDQIISRYLDSLNEALAKQNITL